jgi:hypothetical protein
MGASGELDYLRTEMQVDEGFVAAARAQDIPPEARMRFASPCQKTGCMQWTGDGCGVVRKVLAAIDAQGGLPDAPMQPCVIRASCRWYAERGGAACGACKYVVTDQEAAVAAE